MPLMLQLCRKFDRGDCSMRDCRYAHVVNPLNTKKHRGEVSLCLDFLKGKCNRPECKFFHPPAQWNMDPNTKKKTVSVCSGFLNNECTKEQEECDYAHPQNHNTLAEVHVEVCEDYLRLMNGNFDWCYNSDDGSETTAPPLDCGKGEECNLYHPVPPHVMLEPLKKQLLKEEYIEPPPDYNNGRSRARPRAGGAGSNALLKMQNEMSPGTRNPFDGEVVDIHQAPDGVAGCMEGADGDADDVDGDGNLICPPTDSGAFSGSGADDRGTGPRTRDRDRPQRRERSRDRNGVEKCGEFKAGRCDRGENCKFSHDLGSVLDGGRRGMNKPVDTARMNRAPILSRGNMPSGAEVCMDFKRGRCDRGANCKFFHDRGQDARGPPRGRDSRRRNQDGYRDNDLDRGRSGSSFQNMSSNMNINYTGPTELCADFRMGKCNRGNECKFLHMFQEEASNNGYLFNERGRIVGKQEDRTMPMRGRNDNFNDRGGSFNDRGGGGNRDRGGPRGDFGGARNERGRNVNSDGKELCGDFQLGKCWRKDCRFIHEVRKPDRSNDTGNEVTRRRMMGAALDGGRMNDNSSTFPFAGAAAGGRGMMNANSSFDNGASRMSQNMNNRGRERDRSPRGGGRGGMNNMRNNGAGGGGPPPQGGNIIPCMDYRVGRCNRGGQCKFVHEAGFG